MTVWKYANLALVAAVYICDPRQYKRIEQVRFLMVPITGHTRITISAMQLIMPAHSTYRQMSNISRTKYQNYNVSRLVLQ